METRLTNFEPCFRDLTILDLIDADHVDFSCAVREISLNSFMINNDVAYHCPRVQLPKQIRLLEPFDMARAYLCGICCQEG